MKNRITKFLVMLLTVIAVGSGATMLNLNLHEKEEASPMADALYRRDHPVLPMETTAAAVSEPVDEAINDLAQPALETTAEIIEALSETAEMGAVFMQDATTQSDQEKQEESDSLKIIASGTEEKQEYYTRLQEMERVQAALLSDAMRGSLAEQQSAADKVLKIWDDELNAIYQKLRNSLPDDEFYLLREEERAWIRSRDEAANMAAARENYSNSTQNLAHVRSLLEWTRERVYELAAMYYRD